MRPNPRHPSRCRLAGSDFARSHCEGQDHGASSTPSARKAFTLVEILVVVAILAILAILSAPVINSILARMKTAECQHNMRQLASAFAQYTADNNGTLPGAQWHIPSQHSHNSTKKLQIPDYVNPKWRSLTPWVLTSPFVPRATANRAPYYGGTYGYNTALYDRRFASLKKPSESLVVADAIGFSIWGNTASWHRFVGDHQISRHGSQVTESRNDASGRNFHALFADGHVKLIRAQDYDPQQNNPFPVHWVQVHKQ